MWERNLQDLIRGLRANKKNESKYISQAIDEIRKEVKTKDMEVKAGAILKLTYLEMLGYDMGWASFYVVEVMSSPRFYLKSTGYLAATQSFEQDTDVLMLTTNLLKKDLSSTPADIAIALNGLAHFVTPDLARDLSLDLIAMLNHSRPTIRKRSVLALYKVLLQYPEATERAMPRLKEKLEDSDIGVVSATVNVLCELARQNPQEYLPLAPFLFHIMTTSGNNWMLIKVIKLFGLLAPHEPRLAKKLQPPMIDLISTTPAVSLLYECVHTCIIGGMLQGSHGFTLASTCVTKLAAFLEDPDQNLKYISLLALTKIVPSHPHLIAEYEVKIVSCIEDPDISIRMRALDLISAMVNKDNIQSIIQYMLGCLAQPDFMSNKGDFSASSSLAAGSSSSPSSLLKTSASQSEAFRSTMSKRILAMGSANVYGNITDFEWYISVLIDLAYVSRAAVGSIIKDQLIDLTVRVKQLRKYTVQLCLRILSDENFISGSNSDGESEGSGCQEVLSASAFICGEFCGDLVEPQKVLDYLLQPSVSQLSPSIISTYLQCAMKIFGYWAENLALDWQITKLSDLTRTIDTVVAGTKDFAGHENVEVQERAAEFLQLFAFMQADLKGYQSTTPGRGEGSSSTENGSEINYPKSLFLIRPLFLSHPLNPIAPGAQASVQAPEGLDLNAWIDAEEEKIASGATTESTKVKKKKSKKDKGKEKAGKENGKSSSRVLEPSLSDTERAKLKAERLERQRDDPYYITEESSKPKTEFDVDEIPVVRLDVPLPEGLTASPVPRHHYSRIESRPRSPMHSYTIDRGGEMPTHSAGSTPKTVATPPLVPESAAPPATGTLTPSFREYDAGDDELRTRTPEPIKVTRVKKKDPAKKKRTKAESVVPSSSSKTPTPLPTPHS